MKGTNPVSGTQEVLTDYFWRSKLAKSFFKAVLGFLTQGFAKRSITWATHPALLL
jgi:hypothetical protein